MLPVYIEIIELLKKQGHSVISEHVASAELEKIEARITDEEIFNKDTAYIDECECLVADVTIPSIGVGYEIAHAVSKGKTVLCIYLEGAKVSAMVLGNRQVMPAMYRNMEELESIFSAYLLEIKQ